MRVLGIIWRLIAIPLTIGLIAFLILAALTPEMQDLIIPLYAAGYVLALSTVIRATRLATRFWHPFFKVLAYVIALALGVVLMPLNLFISLFGRFFRIFIRTSDYVSVTEDEIESHRRRIAEEVASDMRKAIWNVSSRRAIDQILDENYKGDIKIDNGEIVKVMKQVALIKLTGKQYVLLSPREDRPEDEENMAYAFAIAPVPPKGRLALVEVTDPKLYRRIFSVYESLVAERAIYG